MEYVPQVLDKMMKTIANILPLLFLAGCGTMMVRDFPSGRSDGLYPATGVDYMMATTGGGIWQTGDCGNAPGWAKTLGWALVAPLHVVDMPVSAIIDTLYLPADIRWDRADKEARSREFRLNVAQISTNCPGVLLVSVATYPENRARFRLLESDEVVDVKIGEVLRCPNPPGVFTLLNGYDAEAILRKEK